MRTPPPPEMTCDFSNSAKKKTMWFIGVEVEQETSAPPPKKSPGSVPDIQSFLAFSAAAAVQGVIGKAKISFSRLAFPSAFAF